MSVYLNLALQLYRQKSTVITKNTKSQREWKWVILIKINNVIYNNIINNAIYTFHTHSTVKMSYSSAYLLFLLKSQGKGKERITALIKC